MTPEIIINAILSFILSLIVGVPILILFLKRLKKEKEGTK